jgi:hypothetical protein
VVSKRRLVFVAMSPIACLLIADWSVFFVAWLWFA